MLCHICVKWEDPGATAKSGHVAADKLFALRASRFVLISLPSRITVDGDRDGSRSLLLSSKE
jgi:hypothetical protein